MQFSIKKEDSLSKYYIPEFITEYDLKGKNSWNIFLQFHLK